MDWDDDALIFPSLDSDFLPRWELMQPQEICSLTLSGSLSLHDRVTVAPAEQYSPLDWRPPILERLGMSSLVSLARKLILHQKVKEVMFAKLQQAVYESSLSESHDAQHLVNDFIHHANQLNKDLENYVAGLAAQMPTDKNTVIAKSDSSDIAQWVLTRYRSGIDPAAVAELADRMKLPKKKLSWLINKRVARLNDYASGKKPRPQWVPPEITDEQLRQLTSKL